MPLFSWDPSAFLSPPSSAAAAAAATTPLALIILNLPIHRREILDRVWASTAARYCADGGANRLYDALPTDNARRSYLPDLIKGDLDSIRPDVRAFYAAEGVSIVHEADQYSTDLMKCIASLGELEQSSGTKYDLVLLGGLTGRLDQTIHTLSLLHRLRRQRDRIWVVSEDEVAWCLDKGEHAIAINHDLLGPTCGILPLGIATATISTKGLEWDVQDWETSFDTQISTSNHLVPGMDEVRITTTEPVWWCCAIR